VYGVTAIDGVSQGMVLVHPDDVERHQARVHQAVERGRGIRQRFELFNATAGESRRLRSARKRFRAVPRLRHCSSASPSTSPSVVGSATHDRSRTR
jgi:hypothetical protein